MNKYIISVPCFLLHVLRVYNNSEVYHVPRRTETSGRHQKQTSSQESVLLTCLQNQCITLASKHEALIWLGDEPVSKTTGFHSLLLMVR